MQWIESNGGPLVVVDEEHLGQWLGTDGNSAGGSDGESDYDRACRVDDYVAVIPTGRTKALVLGDEPHRTTWVKRPNGGLFVRWVYSDSEESIRRSLDAQPIDSALSDNGLTFHVGSQGARLFDSADPGTDIQGENILLHLEPGEYVVSTGVIDPTDDVRLIVHCLKRAES
jgi:hypothetical protein